MDSKGVFLVLAVLAGCMAIPKPDADNDMSIYFEHVYPEGRLVGGVEAPVGAHPHMVALTNGILFRTFFCGGSLLTTRTVLTAAHCIGAVFSSSLSNTLRVTVGTNRWSTGGQTHSIFQNVTHPNYVVSTIKNDIGLLITATQVQLSDLVQTVPITYDFIGAGVPARVAGWGRIRTNGALSAALLQLDVETIDGDECVARALQAEIDLNMRPAPPVEPHIEVCTFHAPNFGTCNGDSGSALIRLSTGEQFGIVSWGFPCARGAPDVFVRVAAYQNWLQSVII